ncbi:hypothetical protein F5144DRAFT_628583 [Chaetomium tenue]|uniref:Uncharacterized protein n=1 Tax=Chaetomium tenue TaxID=1854479 RepID=A0ACB7PCB9_9PEZI|nr:hypothetical protein F5144DRAFT_628583 [Chaetomium globosum]
MSPTRLDDSTTYNNWVHSVFTRFKDGIEPLAEIGTETTQVEKRGREHLHTNHPGLLSEADRYIKPAAVQKVTVGQQNRYFKLSATAPALPPPQGDLSVASMLLTKVDEADEASRMIQARVPNDIETNEFLAKMRFDKHLQGYEPLELTWLLLDPKSSPDVREPLDRIMGALKSVVAKAADHLDTESSTASRIAVCQRINNEGQERRELFVVSKKTTDNYVRIWKQILTYAMRLARYQTEGPGGARILQGHDPLEVTWLPPSALHRYGI